MTRIYDPKIYKRFYEAIDKSMARDKAIIDAAQAVVKEIETIQADNGYGHKFYGGKD